MIVVDNGSGDSSIENVLAGTRSRIIRNSRNEGFARAANQGIVAAGGEMILLLNSDAFLESGYLEECVSTLRRNQAAAVSGKLLKLHDKNLIDSTGHILWGDRRVQDRGEWEEDYGQYDSEEEVFSVPATAALYRMRALEDVLESTGEVFDETFFAYGEDVDLAWRLRLRGWTIHYNPAAVGFHRRAISGTLGPSWLIAGDLRNRYLRMAKNDAFPSFLRHLGEIALTDIRLFLYYLVRRPAVLPLWLWGVIRLIPGALRKRRAVQASRRVHWQQIERWFVRYPYFDAVKRLARQVGLKFGKP